MYLNNTGVQHVGKIAGKVGFKVNKIFIVRIARANKKHTKQKKSKKKIWNASRICVSSLRRGHANLLCIVPILVYVLLEYTHKGFQNVFITYITGVHIALWVSNHSTSHIGSAKTIAIALRKKQICLPAAVADNAPHCSSAQNTWLLYNTLPSDWN